jgi:hypothetical protein
MKQREFDLIVFEKILSIHVEITGHRGEVRFHFRMASVEQTVSIVWIAPTQHSLSLANELSDTSCTPWELLIAPIWRLTPMQSTC